MNRRKYSRLAIITVVLFLSIFIWQYRTIPAVGNNLLTNSPVTIAANVHIQPTTQTVRLGDTFDITVAISGLTTPLSAFQFDLGYDQDRIRFVGLTTGSFLASTGRMPICPQPAFPTAGSLRLACAVAGKEPGPIGSGVLLNITFTSVLTGTTQITLSSPQLAGPGLPPANIAATTEGGTVIIVPELQHEYYIHLPLIVKGR